MTYAIDIQREEEPPSCITDELITLWAKTALINFQKEGELTVRLVNSHEIQTLNHAYRAKNYPTNVLSFPCELPPGIELKLPLLGDIVICNAMVIKEARAQNKSIQAHFAHLIIHGVLHLLGYNHIEPNDAAIMEPLEIKLLHQLGYNNPYEIHDEPLT